MAMVYRAQGRLPKPKNPWRWAWRLVILLTICGYLYAADYTDMVDVPILDQAHDQEQINGS